MSDNIKNYGIKVTADIEDAKKKITELENLFNDTIKNKSVAKSFMNNMEKIVDEFATLETKVKSEVKKINDELGKIGKPKSDENQLKSLSDNIEKQISSITNSVDILKKAFADKDMFKDLMKSINIVNDSINELSNTLTTAMSQGIKLPTGGKNIANNPVENIGKAFEDAGKEANKKIKNSAKDVEANINQYIKEIEEKLNKTSVYKGKNKVKLLDDNSLVNENDFDKLTKKAQNSIIESLSKLRMELLKSNDKSFDDIIIEKFGGLLSSENLDLILASAIDDKYASKIGALFQNIGNSTSENIEKIAPEIEKAEKKVAEKINKTQTSKVNELKFRYILSGEEVEEGTAKGFEALVDKINENIVKHVEGKIKPIRIPIGFSTGVDEEKIEQIKTEKGKEAEEVRNLINQLQITVKDINKEDFLKNVGTSIKEINKFLSTPTAPKIRIEAEAYLNDQSVREQVDKLEEQLYENQEIHGKPGVPIGSISGGSFDIGNIGNIATESTLTAIYNELVKLTGGTQKVFIENTQLNVVENEPGTTQSSPTPTTSAQPSAGATVPKEYDPSKALNNVRHSTRVSTKVFKDALETEKFTVVADELQNRIIPDLEDIQKFVYKAAAESAKNIATINGSEKTIEEKSKAIEDVNISFRNKLTEELGKYDYYTSKTKSNATNKEYGTYSKHGDTYSEIGEWQNNIVKSLIEEHDKGVEVINSINDDYQKITEVYKKDFYVFDNEKDAINKVDTIKSFSKRFVGDDTLDKLRIQQSYLSKDGTEILAESEFNSYKYYLNKSVDDLKKNIVSTKEIDSLTEDEKTLNKEIEDLRKSILKINNSLEKGNISSDEEQVLKANRKDLGKQLKSKQQSYKDITDKLSNSITEEQKKANRETANKLKNTIKNIIENFILNETKYGVVVPEEISKQAANIAIDKINASKKSQISQLKNKYKTKSLDTLNKEKDEAQQKVDNLVNEGTTGTKLSNANQTLRNAEKAVRERVNAINDYIKQYAKDFEGMSEDDAFNLASSRVFDNEVRLMKQRRDAEEERITQDTQELINSIRQSDIVTQTMQEKINDAKKKAQDNELTAIKNSANYSVNLTQKKNELNVLTSSTTDNKGNSKKTFEELLFRTPSNRLSRDISVDDIIQYVTKNQFREVDYNKLMTDMFDAYRKDNTSISSTKNASNVLHKFEEILIEDEKIKLKAQQAYIDGLKNEKSELEGIIQLENEIKNDNVSIEELTKNISEENTGFLAKDQNRYSELRNEIGKLIKQREKATDDKQVNSINSEISAYEKEIQNLEKVTTATELLINAKARLREISANTGVTLDEKGNRKVYLDDEIPAGEHTWKSGLLVDAQRTLGSMIGLAKKELKAFVGQYFTRHNMRNFNYEESVKKFRDNSIEITDIKSRRMNGVNFYGDADKLRRLEYQNKELAKDIVLWQSLNKETNVVKNSLNEVEAIDSKLTALEESLTGKTNITNLPLSSNEAKEAYFRVGNSTADTNILTLDQRILETKNKIEEAQEKVNSATDETKAKELENLEILNTELNRYESVRANALATSSLGGYENKTIEELEAKRSDLELIVNDLTKYINSIDSKSDDFNTRISEEVLAEIEGIRKSYEAESNALANKIAKLEEKGYLGAVRKYNKQKEYADLNISLLSEGGTKKLSSDNIIRNRDAYKEYKKQNDELIESLKKSNNLDDTTLQNQLLLEYELEQKKIVQNELTQACKEYYDVVNKGDSEVADKTYSRIQNLRDEIAYRNENIKAIKSSFTGEQKEFATIIEFEEELDRLTRSVGMRPGKDETANTQEGALLRINELEKSRLEKEEEIKKVEEQINSLSGDDEKANQLRTQTLVTAKTELNDINSQLVKAKENYNRIADRIEQLQGLISENYSKFGIKEENARTFVENQAKMNDATKWGLMSTPVDQLSEGYIKARNNLDEAIRLNNGNLITELSNLISIYKEVIDLRRLSFEKDGTITGKHSPYENLVDYLTKQKTQPYINAKDTVLKAQNELNLITSAINIKAEDARIESEQAEQLAKRLSVDVAGEREKSNTTYTAGIEANNTIIAQQEEELKKIEENLNNNEQIKQIKEDIVKTNAEIVAQEEYINKLQSEAAGKVESAVNNTKTKKQINQQNKASYSDIEFNQSVANQKNILKSVYDNLVQNLKNEQIGLKSLYTNANIEMGFENPSKKASETVLKVLKNREDYINNVVLPLKNELDNFDKLLSSDELNKGKNNKQVVAKRANAIKDLFTRIQNVTGEAIDIDKLIENNATVMAYKKSQKSTDTARDKARKKVTQEIEDEIKAEKEKLNVLKEQLKVKINSKNEQVDKFYTQMSNANDIIHQAKLENDKLTETHEQELRELNLIEEEQLRVKKAVEETNDAVDSSINKEERLKKALESEVDLARQKELEAAKEIDNKKLGRQRELLPENTYVEEVKARAKEYKQAKRGYYYAGMTDEQASVAKEWFELQSSIKSAGKATDEQINKENELKRKLEELNLTYDAETKYINALVSRKEYYADPNKYATNEITKKSLGLSTDSTVTKYNGSITVSNISGLATENTLVDIYNELVKLTGGVQKVKIEGSTTPPSSGGVGNNNFDMKSYLSISKELFNSGVLKSLTSYGSPLKEDRHIVYDEMKKRGLLSSNSNSVKENTTARNNNTKELNKNTGNIKKDANNALLSINANKYTADERTSFVAKAMNTDMSIWKNKHTGDFFFANKDTKYIKDAINVTDKYKGKVEELIKANVKLSSSEKTVSKDIKNQSKANIENTDTVEQLRDKLSTITLTLNNLIDHMAIAMQSDEELSDEESAKLYAQINQLRTEQTQLTKDISNAENNSQQRVNNATKLISQENAQLSEQESLLAEIKTLWDEISKHRYKGNIATGNKSGNKERLNEFYTKSAQYKKLTDSIAEVGMSDKDKEFLTNYFKGLKVAVNPTVENPKKTQEEIKKASTPTEPVEVDTKSNNSKDIEKENKKLENQKKLLQELKTLWKEIKKHSYKGNIDSKSNFSRLHEFAQKSKDYQKITNQKIDFGFTKDEKKVLTNYWQRHSGKMVSINADEQEKRDEKKKTQQASQQSAQAETNEGKAAEEAAKQVVEAEKKKQEAYSKTEIELAKLIKEYYNLSDVINVNKMSDLDKPEAKRLNEVDSKLEKLGITPHFNNNGELVFLNDQLIEYTEKYVDLILQSADAAKNTEKEKQDAIKQTKAITQQVSEQTKLQDNLGREIDENNAKLLEGTKLIENYTNCIITLFHKSEAAFDKFDASKLGVNTTGSVATGAWFSTHPNYTAPGENNVITQWYGNINKLYSKEQKFSDTEIQKIIEEYFYALDNAKKEEVRKLLSANDIQTLIHNGYKGYSHISKQYYENAINTGVNSPLKGFQEEGDFYNNVLRSLGYQGINYGETICIFDLDNLYRANNSILKTKKEINEITQLTRNSINGSNQNFPYINPYESKISSGTTALSQIDELQTKLKELKSINDKASTAAISKNMESISQLISKESLSTEELVKLANNVFNIDNSKSLSKLPEDIQAVVKSINEYIKTVLEANNVKFEPLMGKKASEFEEYDAAYVSADRAKYLSDSDKSVSEIRKPAIIVANKLEQEGEVIIDAIDSSKKLSKAEEDLYDIITNYNENLKSLKQIQKIALTNGTKEQLIERGYDKHTGSLLASEEELNHDISLLNSIEEKYGSFIIELENGEKIILSLDDAFNDNLDKIKESNSRIKAISTSESNGIRSHGYSNEQLISAYEYNLKCIDELESLVGSQEAIDKINKQNDYLNSLLTERNYSRVNGVWSSNKNGVSSGDTTAQVEAQADAHRDNTKAVEEEVDATQNLINVLKELSKYKNGSINREEQALLFNSSNSSLTDVITGTSIGSDGKAHVDISNLVQENLKKNFDTFVHSHPAELAMFSEGDLEKAFKMISMGFKNAILVSTEQIASLNTSAIKTEDQKTIIDAFTKLKKQTISELFTDFQNYGNMQSILQNGTGIDDFKSVFSQTLSTSKSTLLKPISDVLNNNIEKYITDTFSEFDSTSEVSKKDFKDKFTIRIESEFDKLANQFGLNENQLSNLKQRYIYPAISNAFQTFNSSLSHENWVNAFERSSDTMRELETSSQNIFKTILQNMGYEVEKIFSVQSVEGFAKNYLNGSLFSNITQPNKTNISSLQSVNGVDNYDEALKITKANYEYINSLDLTKLKIQELIDLYEKLYKEQNIVNDNLHFNQKQILMLENNGAETVYNAIANRGFANQDTEFEDATSVAKMREKLAEANSNLAKTENEVAVAQEKVNSTTLSSSMTSAIDDTVARFKDALSNMNGNEFTIPFNEVLTRESAGKIAAEFNLAFKESLDGKGITFKVLEDSMIQDTAEAGKKVANVLKTSTEEALGINSPSKVFQEIGYWCDEGLKKGLESGEIQISGTVAEIRDKLVEAFKQDGSTLKEVGEFYSSSFFNGARGTNLGKAVKQIIDKKLIPDITTSTPTTELQNIQNTAETTKTKFDELKEHIIAAIQTADGSMIKLRSSSLTGFFTDKDGNNLFNQIFEKLGYSSDRSYSSKFNEKAFYQIFKPNSQTIQANADEISRVFEEIIKLGWEKAVNDFNTNDKMNISVGNQALVDSNAAIPTYDFGNIVSAADETKEQVKSDISEVTTEANKSVDEVSKKIEEISLTKAKNQVKTAGFKVNDQELKDLGRQITLANGKNGWLIPTNELNKYIEALRNARQVETELATQTVTDENAVSTAIQETTASTEQSTQKISARVRAAKAFDVELATEKQLKNALNRADDAKTNHYDSSPIWESKREAITNRLLEIERQRQALIDVAKQKLNDEINLANDLNEKKAIALDLARKNNIALEEANNITITQKDKSNIWSFEDKNHRYTISETINEQTGEITTAVTKVEELNTEYNKLKKVISEVERARNKYSNISTYNSSMFGNQAKDVDRVKEILAYFNTIDINNINQKALSIQNLQKMLAELNTKSSKFTSDGTVYNLGVDKDLSSLTTRKDELLRIAQAYTEGEVAETKFYNNNRKLTYAVKDANNMMQTYEYTLLNTGEVTRKLVSETKYVGLFGKALDGLKGKFAEIIRYSMASFSIYRLISTFKSGIEIVKQLDSAMIEMQKVSNDSKSALEAFAKQSHKTAQEIGSTAETLQQSAADWMRLGYSISEAAELSKNTSILMNVSEFESIDEATESMVAMVQAFKDANKDVGDLSLEIIDKLNNIGNNFSISTSELAESLKRSSGTLIAAGNDINEAVALTTAGNALIQDAESTGSALKVISMRLRGTKAEELEDMGEDTEGLIETTSKLEKKVRQLTSVGGQKGISILNDNGNYRSTYEILQDIADIWEQINEEDQATGQNRQAALLELLAGKNLPEIYRNIYL